MSGSLTRDGGSIGSKLERTLLVQRTAPADSCRSCSESKREKHNGNDDEEEGGEEGERVGRSNPRLLRKTSQSMALLVT
jgi:hypothetical protein